MLRTLPFRSLAICLAFGALVGCQRDFVSVNPNVTPPPPKQPDQVEPPKLQYRIKRLVSGKCSGSGVMTTDFSYTKDLFVDKTTWSDDVQELGTPITVYKYDAGGRLLSAAFEEKIKRQSGQRSLVYSYTYTPASIVELAEEQYADGSQAFGFRHTYTLSGGVITGCKEQYVSGGVPGTNQWTYEYTNGNITRMTCKDRFGQLKLDHSFEYDNKPNPLYRDATYNWVGSYLAGINRECLSRNNVVKVTIRSPYDPNTVTVRTRQYTYNEQGLPLTQTQDIDGCQVARYEYETY